MVNFLSCSVWCYSETSPDGKKKTTKLGQTLLNGNNICMVRPIQVTPSASDSIMDLIDSYPYLYLFFGTPAAHSRFGRTGGILSQPRGLFP